MNSISQLKLSIKLNDSNLVPLLKTSVIKSMLQFCEKRSDNSSVSFSRGGKRFLTLRLKVSFKT